MSGTIPTRCLPVTADSLADAVTLLRAGELVAFPTETVYGLGADARSPDALARIFAAKGRPADHPLIVHLADGDDPMRWAREWSPLAQRLAEAFWPGPLTLIVPRQPGVPDAVTGGQDTVGLRCPSHASAQALLHAFGGALAAPSANRFGRISPTAAAHVMEELSGRIPLVLDGGDAPVGIESTIIDVSRGFPVLLRPGDIDASAIERVLGQRLARPDATAPRVSGSLDSHYAPERTLLQIPGAALPDMLSAHHASASGPIAVLTWSPVVVQACQARGYAMCDHRQLGQEPQGAAGLSASAGFCLVLPADAHALAHYLYAALRWADHLPVRAIWAEQAPDITQWEGVADRLRRASAGRH